MEIDDRWQAAYGDLEFDSAKFPDAPGMVRQLHALGFKVGPFSLLRKRYAMY